MGRRLLQAAKVDPADRVCIADGLCAVCGGWICKGQFALPADIVSRPADQAVCAWCFEKAIRAGVLRRFGRCSAN